MTIGAIWPVQYWCAIKPNQHQLNAYTLKPWQWVLWTSYSIDLYRVDVLQNPTNISSVKDYTFKHESWQRWPKYHTYATNKIHFFCRILHMILPKDHRKPILCTYVPLILFIQSSITYFVNLMKTCTVKMHCCK